MFTCPPHIYSFRAGNLQLEGTPGNSSVHSPNLIDVEAQAQGKEIIYHTPYSFPGGSVSKESACSAGDWG